MSGTVEWGTEDSNSANPKPVGKRVPIDPSIERRLREFVQRFHERAGLELYDTMVFRVALEWLLEHEQELLGAVEGQDFLVRNPSKKDAQQIQILEQELLRCLRTVRRGEGRGRE